MRYLSSPSPPPIPPLSLSISLSLSLSQRSVMQIAVIRAHAILFPHYLCFHTLRRTPSYSAQHILCTESRCGTSKAVGGAAAIPASATAANRSARPATAATRSAKWRGIRPVILQFVAACRALRSVSVCREAGAGKHSGFFKILPQKNKKKGPTKAFRILQVSSQKKTKKAHNTALDGKDEQKCAWRKRARSLRP